MIQRALFYCQLFLAIFITWQVSGQTSSAVTATDLKKYVSFLASDDLKGRYPGTKEDKIAAEYIRDSFKKSGLRLMYDEGLQTFEVVTKIYAGENNSLSIRNKKYSIKEEFMPASFSKSDQLAAVAYFAGFGFSMDDSTLKWDDYKDLDVKGKWVMILRGDPDMGKDTNRFEAFSDDRDKVLTARDKGAAGVILVSGPQFDKTDALPELSYDKTQSDAGLPVIHVKRSVADDILATSANKIADLESRMIEEQRSYSFTLPALVDATVEIIHEQVKTFNVVAALEGSDPVLKQEYIIIGAHYDHLGMGGRGSGSRAVDTLAVHNGADDNASGVAGIMELAEYYGTGSDKPARTLIFVSFGAEELGILGSKHFARNMPVPVKSVNAMINFDMIGRMDPEKKMIMIGGSGTAVESDSLLNQLNNGRFYLSLSAEGFGPSDHASFYAENIPVFFFTTGAHTDYHTPEDDFDKLNYSGEESLLEYSIKLIDYIGNSPASLTFQEAGPKEQQGKGYRFKVTLGIMPDFTATDVQGVGVGGCRKDGPAEKAGLMKGDVIVAMDGMPVNNIYDYMSRLEKLKAGQRVSVDVMRNGKKEVLIIQL